MAPIPPHLLPAKDRLAEFTKLAFQTVDPGTAYLHNWHIDLIAEYLEACSRREIKRLIINMPPRYLKSICGSVAWPAWLLGRNPSEKIIAASYSQSLSRKHSVDCRLVVRSKWFRSIFPLVNLTEDQDTKDKFVTTARGARFATSVGSSAVGEGGNFLIVDDALTPQQALSKLERDGANIWFDQTFSTRLDDKENGVIVVIGHRLHADDITGHLLAKGGWTHLSLPALAESKTIIDFGRVHHTREVGDPLQPARESAEAIEAQKTALGSYAFSGQYQQRPVPVGGGMCKAEWFRRYTRRQDVYDMVVQSWDTAIKAAQINDPSVCLTFGVRRDGADLLDVFVARLEYPELRKHVIRQFDAHAPSSVLIEDKASGQQLLQDLRQSTTLPLIGILPVSDKITRFSAVTAMIEAGKLALPETAHWLTDYEVEMLTFPSAPHDDQVDGTSQFLDWLRARSTAVAPRIRSL